MKPNYVKFGNNYPRDLSVIGPFTIYNPSIVGHYFAINFNSFSSNSFNLFEEFMNSSCFK